MGLIKLRNNTGLASERNICYVNSMLQLLKSVNEFEDLFTTGRYRVDKKSKLPVSDEISRIFKFSGNSPTSASALRSLVARLSGKHYLADGSHQDCLEFLETLLEELLKELEKSSPDAVKILNMFWGKEIQSKIFLETNDGSCMKCGQLPLRREEKFFIKKLYVKELQGIMSLQNLIEINQVEEENNVQMKCSNCTEDKMKEALDKNVISVSPEFLLVTLMRFPHYRHIKVKTLVSAEKILTLPNKDKFILTAICDHHGEFISSGHYTTTVRQGDQWFKCDDQNINLIRSENMVHKSNYIYLYKKIGKHIPQSEADQTKEKNCGDPHEGKSNQNGTCSGKTYFDRYKLPYHGERSTEKNSCKACNKSFKNLLLHLKRAPGCQESYNIEKLEE